MLEHNRIFNNNLEDSFHINLDQSFDELSVEEQRRRLNEETREIQDMDEEIFEDQKNKNRVDENAPIQLESVKVEQKSNKPYKEEDRYHYVEMDVGHKVDRLVKFIPGVMGVGGDGYYMAKLKNLIRTEDYKRHETFADGAHIMGVPYQDYDPDSINDSLTDEELQKITSIQSDIIWTCRKYRLTHLWPWTKRGKERKEDVVAVQKEAQARYNAAKAILDQRKAAKRNMSAEEREQAKATVRAEKENAREFQSNYRSGEKTSYSKTTSGFRNIYNTFKSYFVGGIIRNVINTAAMVTAFPFWLIGSACTSVYHLSWDGAFSLPHAHRPSTWYNYYTLNMESNLESKRLAPETKILEKEKKELDKQLAIEKKKFAPLEKKMKEYEAKHAEEEKRIGQLKDKLREEMNKTDSNDEEISRLRDEVEKKEVTISKLKDSISKLRENKEYLDLKSNIEEMEKSSREKGTKISNNKNPGYHAQGGTWHKFFSGPSDKLVHQKHFGYTDRSAYNYEVDYNNMQQI